MECVVCGTKIGKKARTCSAKCRQRAKRSVTLVTVDRCDKPSVTDLEQCQYCSKSLPALSKPRCWPGVCYDCALKQPRQASVDSLGELVYAGSEYVEAEL